MLAVLVMATALVPVGAKPAAALTYTLVNQTFSGSTWPADWTRIGTALPALTTASPPTNQPANWLRLTTESQSQHGTVI